MRALSYLEERREIRARHLSEHVAFRKTLVTNQSDPSLRSHNQHTMSAKSASLTQNISL